jgi:small neutral amino acid transporter SnatA (MarC family)
LSENRRGDFASCSTSCSKNAASVLRRLGETGTLVMMRLMAFILLCVGIQIMWNGWAELNGMKL